MLHGANERQVYPFPDGAPFLFDIPGLNADFAQAWLSQGCLPTSFYSKDVFETPNGQTIPFVALDEFGASAFSGAGHSFLLKTVDPYASQTQSTNLRVIQSLIRPSYRAKNDMIEFNADYAVTDALIAPICSSAPSTAAST